MHICEKVPGLYWLSISGSLGALASAQFPAPQGYVNDFAKVIDQRSGSWKWLRQLKKEQGIELAVVTIQTTDLTIPPNTVLASLRSGGLAGPKTAALILLAMEERAIEVETGYGLEGWCQMGRSVPI